MAKNQAYTLIETVVVLGLFLLLGVTLLPYSIDQVNKSRVDNSAKTLMIKLYTQQQYSYSQYADLSYGIILNDTNFTLISGYSSDNYQTIETIAFERGVKITAKSLNLDSNIIYFPFGSIKPDNYGRITVSDGNQNYYVELNQEGMLNYHRQ